MTAAGAGRGFFANAGMPGNDFGEFLSDSDELFGASSPLPDLDFSGDPDSLHQFNSSKPFLTPQPLSGIADPVIAALDSPSGSFRDSSSDSASSKRSDTSDSSKTAMTATGDVMMTDGLVKSEWNLDEYAHQHQHHLNRPEDNVYGFNPQLIPSGPEALYNDYDEKFMEEAFDFDSASSSPDAAGTGTGAGAVARPPDMPVIKSMPPQPKSLADHHRGLGHNKNLSQVSLTRGMNGLRTSGSRSHSPMSNLTSQNSSPAAVLNNSPSPGSFGDYSHAQPVGNPHGHMVWQPSLDMAPEAMPHALNVPFGGSAHIPRPPQLHNFTAYSQYTGPFRLDIHPTPAKSRVETQIPIRMTLSPLPPGIKRLHLPTHTISKPKLLAKPTPERSPDMLELYTMLVCTSAMQTQESREKALKRAATASHTPAQPPREEGEEDEEDKPQNGGEVQICAGCITRERKRAARKKIKKHEEEEMWNRDEARRVIVFNTQEIKEWQPVTGPMTEGAPPPPQQYYPFSSMQVDAPMRIACYCRHHGEKSGFQVVFTIKDCNDTVIAQAFSPSIMITDDHKTPSMPASLSTQVSQLSDSMPQMMDTVPENGSLTPGRPFRPSHSSSDLQSLQRNATFPSVAASMAAGPSATTSIPRTLSRPASPTSHAGPLAKKRKSSGSRIALDLNMTPLAPLDTTSPSAGQVARTQPGSTATSPFMPNSHGLPSDVMFGHNMPSAGIVPPAPFGTGPPTPNSNDQVLFTSANRSASMDNMSMPQMYSAPTSAHASRAPSPIGLRNSVNAILPVQFGQQVNGMYTLPLNLAQARPAPTIFKIIPNEGPKSGGIEVTLLGQGFFQGLEVLFGDQKATTTTYWGEQSLVCLLPPSPVAGTVLVTLKQQQGPQLQYATAPGKQPVFKYVDDDEDKLIRTALSVLGHKMSGQMEDVCDLARRILGESSGNTWRMGGQNGAQGGSGFTSASQSSNIETQLLRCLELMDLDDSPNRTRLDLRRSTGQTMLHLACARGFHRLVAGLLVRGANPDTRDRGGFTPMHFAAMNDQPEIVRRLIQVGADPTIRSLSGLAPADVARSRDVLRAIRMVERVTRSRSGGSLHSRANSAASLRSLWEPTTTLPAFDVAGGESPEYSSFEDDPDDDDQTWLDMRSSRTLRHASSRDNILDSVDDLEPEQPAPSNAVASALRDQVATQLQQFQQSMTLHLQNIQQMNFPQMPGMPLLPDYQAYVSAAFMARLASLMPGMSNSRPGSSDENSPKMDSRWWRSFSSSKEAPPPAYEDIYPQGDMDTKVASAALAAAEAEADSKCAAKYDQQLVEEAAESSTAPGTLKLPRKATIITNELRQPWLAAYNPTRSTQDKKLFFIWIPLLLCMICAFAYTYFPPLIATTMDGVRTVVRLAAEAAATAQDVAQERVVEVL